MKPLLIWESGVFPEEEKEIAKSFFCVKEFEAFLKPGEPFVFRGSLAAAGRLNINLDKFDCRKFVPHLESYMVSQDFWWDIPERVAEWPLFIRPDSSRKIFSGQVYSEELWLAELNYLRQQGANDCLVFCARPSEVLYEWRCLFVGMELVGISPYMHRGEILENGKSSLISSFHPDLVNLAREIRGNKMFYPEENIVVDLCSVAGESGFKLVEINYLETSGWYFVDKEKIYSKLAKQII